MATDIEARLAELGLKLPDAPSPAANYVPCAVAGGLVFISGQAPVRDGQYVATGRVGAEVSLEAALGVAALRGNVPVVIDAIFELAD